MHFDKLGHLCAPLSGLLVSLGIDVELGQEGLHIVCIRDGYAAGFKILVEIYLPLVSLTWRDSIFFL